MLPTDKLADLRALILASGSLRALGSAGNDSGIAAALNSPTVTVHRRITKQAILRWAAATGGLKKLRVAAADLQNGLQAASEAALSMLSSDLPSMTIDAEVLTMLDTLVTGSVLSSNDKTAFMTRAEEVISQAENELGQNITAADVGAALLADRPDGKIAPLPES
jgi:hypothetical protein